jgi:membrane associated rhomboid family serine protease
LRSDASSSPPRGPLHFGPPQLWSITQWLIVVDVATFVIDVVTDGRITAWCLFSAELAIRRMQLWRFVTCLFVHGDVGHLFFNMICLWFAGPLVEEILGRWRYLAFYVICGMGGVAGYLLLWASGWLVNSPTTGLVGASAAIMGVLVAAAKFAPQMPVRLLFMITISQRVLVWGLLGVAVLVVLVRGPNAGGQAAHLGGALVGAVLIANRHWLNWFDPQRRGRRRFWRPGDPASNFFRRDG